MFGLMPRRREPALLPAEWNPFEMLRREFMPLLNRMFTDWPTLMELPREIMGRWEVNVEEREKEVVVRAELPGFALNEIEVLLVGPRLTIRAEHKEEAPKTEPPVPVERHYGRVERLVMLPEGILPEKVEATYRNGMLEVHVPRAPETMPRRIEVKT
jgi:HSP20 family protein